MMSHVMKVWRRNYSCRRDVLREMTRNEVADLKILYKSSGPLFSNAYGLIYNHLDRQLNTKLTFYTHRYGRLETNGTFVAISREKDYKVTFCSLETFQAELHESLMKTKRIIYERSPLFMNIRQRQVSNLDECRRKKQLSVTLESEPVHCVIPKEVACNYEIVIPGNINILPLSLEHIRLIDEYNFRKCMGSNLFVESPTMIPNRGYGIFSKENNEICAWIFPSDYLGPGLLQTKESYYRKGYGTLLAKFFCRQMALNHNENINVFILRSNVNCRLLYAKIGSEQTQYLRWMKLNKTEKSKLIFTIHKDKNTNNGDSGR